MLGAASNSEKLKDIDEGWILMDTQSSASECRIN
jgi:hypothetical protein